VPHNICFLFLDDCLISGYIIIVFPVIEFNEAAFKHGVTEEDIRYAFDHIIFDHPVTGEEEKNLLIGFDTKANILEILYNAIGDQIIKGINTAGQAAGY
jgi:uncharacterized DUF497 family protein